MELVCRAADEVSVEVFIEPWGDFVEVPRGDLVRVLIDAEVVEVAWTSERLTLHLEGEKWGVRIVARNGEALMEYETN
jgi:hypothetical protein